MVGLTNITVYVVLVTQTLELKQPYHSINSQQYRVSQNYKLTLKR